MLDHPNVCEKIHNIAKSALVQFRTGKILGENVLQSFVFFLNRTHSVIDNCADFGSVGLGCDHGPTRIHRDKEDTFGGVLIDVFFETITFCQQFLILFLKAVRDILQED